MRTQFSAHSRGSGNPEETTDSIVPLDPRLRGDERPAHASQRAKPSVAVIIPTFNEAESIAAVVAEIPRTLVDRVIVCSSRIRCWLRARRWLVFVGRRLLRTPLPGRLLGRSGGF